MLRDIILPKPILTHLPLHPTHQADFYLSLYYLKQIEQTDPLIKTFLDSIHFDDTITKEFVNVCRKELLEANVKLLISYKIFETEDRGEKKYLAILLSGFNEFRKSLLGKRIFSLYILLSKFLKYKEKTDDPAFKAGVAIIAKAWTNSVKKDNINPYFLKIMDVIELPQTKKELEARTKVIEILYEVIEHFFPDESLHFKYTVTGYFSAPLGFIFTREEYYESKLRYSYAQHVRNTVKNTLHRKR